MKCGEVFQSVKSWQKLAGINMRPKLAYEILKYTKAVGVEYEVIEKQRVALVHEITNTKLGEDAKIEPESEEFRKYIAGLNEILDVESDLDKLDVEFSDVIDAVDEKSEVLTVSDLAALEPFFYCPDDCCPDDCCPDDCDQVDVPPCH